MILGMPEEEDSVPISNKRKRSIFDDPAGKRRSARVSGCHINLLALQLPNFGFTLSKIMIMYLWLSKRLW